MEKSLLIFLKIYMFFMLFLSSYFMILSIFLTSSCKISKKQKLVNRYIQAILSLFIAISTFIIIKLLLI